MRPPLNPAGDRPAEPQGPAPEPPHPEPAATTIAAQAVLSLALACAALFARLRFHPTHVHDPEDAGIATLAREVLGGHLVDLPSMQPNLYLGSSLLDPLLGAGTFALFGDTLLAWHAVGIGYGLAFAAALSLLLVRSGWARWVWLPGLLLSAAPFPVLDGFVARVGGHSSGVVWAMVALAVGAGRGSAWWRGLFGGVVLAFACWYSRTSVVAVPALVVVVGGGWRGLLGVCVGLSTLLGMLAGTTELLHGTKIDGAAQTWIETFHRVAWNVWGTREPQPVGEKLLQASGLSFADQLFAAPRVGREGWLWSVGGAAWAWTLAGAPLLAAFAGLAWRGIRGRLGMALGGLALGYMVAYAASDLSIEPGTLRAGVAPGISGARYLVPGWAAALGAAVWVVAALPWRWLRALVLAPLLAIGWTTAALDAEQAGEPAVHLAALVPFNYSAILGPRAKMLGDIHRTCDSEDPLSRANHLRARGALSRGRLDLREEDPERVRKGLQARPWATLEDPRARAFAAHGLGGALADLLWSTDALSPDRILEQAQRMADVLPPGDADALAFGFIEAAAGVAERFEALEGACDSTRVDSLRWCPLEALRHCTWSGGHIPQDLGQLFHPAWWETVPPEGRPGAAWAVGLLGLSLTPADASKTPWSPEEDAAFQAGLGAGWRTRWRMDFDSWTPQAVP